LIAYDGTYYQDPFDFPEFTLEELEAQDAAQDELHSRPEVQEALKKHLEHHYLNEWPKTKLPALGGITPLRAAKSEKGRVKLSALIDDMERHQENSNSAMPQIDFDKVRRKCGLLGGED
jgi:hypothetical protein